MLCTYRYQSSNSSLEEVAAEPSCNWMTAVGMLDDSTFIGAEHHYNLFTGEPLLDDLTASNMYFPFLFYN